jgi:zinc-binding alcohol dehydrogenase family protein
VKAVSINPVDAKARNNLGNPNVPVENPPRILGWDASGVVEQIGGEVNGFKVGDEVYFAGVLNRNGSNAEYVVVDHRIVSLKPKTIDHCSAASLPLVSITAWEGLVEQLNIPVPSSVEISKDDEAARINRQKSLLVVGGAGGVGSVVIQLAKKILGIGQIIATASRESTSQFVRDLGADHVINHRQDLAPQLSAIGFPSGVDYIYNCYEANENIDQLIPLLAVFGRIVNITGVEKPLDISSIFLKRATITFEFMFARPMFGKEPEMQGKLLENIAKWIDAGVIRHTATKKFDRLDAQTIREAHETIETGTVIGKIVILANFS